MSGASLSSFAPARAFDELAENYDTLFTDTSIGRAQRKAVWACAAKVFAPGLRLLELNCGTGEDALHFARRGLTVTAFDVSPGMVAQAARKAAEQGMQDSVSFQVRAIEEIETIQCDRSFEAAFSNFSGLNCVQDLSKTAEALAHLMQPGAPLLFCFSTRFCLWEILWFLLRGDFKRAFRRWRGYHQVRLGGTLVPVYYPTLAQIRRHFSAEFQFVTVYGIGITVPPSYVQSWIASRPRILRFFERIDSIAGSCMGLRVLGDHMLVHLERRPA